MLQSLHLAGPLVAMLQSMLHDCRACFRAAWTSDNFVELDGYFAEWAVEEKNIALVAKNKRLPVAHRRDGCDLSTLCLVPKRDFVCILRPYARWG